MYGWTHIHSIDCSSTTSILVSSLNGKNFLWWLLFPSSSCSLKAIFAGRMCNARSENWCLFIPAESVALTSCLLASVQFDTPTTTTCFLCGNSLILCSTYESTIHTHVYIQTEWILPPRRRKRKENPLLFSGFFSYNGSRIMSDDDVKSNVKGIGIQATVNKSMTA